MTEIVDLRFSFYNKEMLCSLYKRAEALRKKKFEKAKRYEADLDLIKDQQFYKIRQPHTFYCTFEHAVAAQEFLKLEKISWLRQEKIELKTPKDPTDIQFTNKGIRRSSHVCRLIVVLGIGFLGNLTVILTQFIVAIDWQ